MAFFPSSSNRRISKQTTNSNAAGPQVPLWGAISKPRALHVDIHQILELGIELSLEIRQAN
jgi:hypothetical protein